MLDEKEIRVLYNGEDKHSPDSTVDPDCNFKLTDLVRETIDNIRTVSTHRINPGNVQVIDFKSGRTLIIGVEDIYSDTGAVTSITNTHVYLIETDRRVSYACDPFNLS
jgi:hypothetical protein